MRTTGEARYDGFADWYGAFNQPHAAANRSELDDVLDDGERKHQLAEEYLFLPHYGPTVGHVTIKMSGQRPAASRRRSTRTATAVQAPGQPSRETW